MRLTKQTFSQKMHDIGPQDETPKFEIELVDAGGGEYALITASHWAVEIDEEIDEMAMAIKSMLKGRWYEAPAAQD